MLGDPLYSNARCPQQLPSGQPRPLLPGSRVQCAPLGDYPTPKMQCNTIQRNTIQHNAIMLGRTHIRGRVIHLCGRLPASLVFPTPRCASLLDNITAVRTFSGLPDPKNAMQCNTIQYNTIQYNTIYHNTIQCNNIGACAHLGSGNSFIAVLCCSVLLCAILCCSVLSGHMSGPPVDTCATLCCPL